MKTLTKLALAFTILTSAFAAQADWVGGYFRSNGTYVTIIVRAPARWAAVPAPVTSIATPTRRCRP